MKKKRLVFLLSRFPYPLDKGDKLRAYHQIRSLSEYYDIFLIALNDGDIPANDLDALKTFCQEIRIFPIRQSTRYWQLFKNIFNSWPAQVAYFFQPTLKATIIKEINSFKPDLVFGQLSRTALYLKELPYQVVMDFQDAFSANYFRLSKEGSLLQRIFYKREALRMQKFERQMLVWFKNCLIISEADKACIARNDQRIHVIPNGVDTHYFTRRIQAAEPALLFVGNLSYEPNIQAIQYLVREILPLLIPQIPDILLKIAGANPHPSILALANKHVQVTGWMDDIRNAYESASIFVAPLFSGAGMQNKLLEAMSMQLPCVTTSLVNNGIGAIPDKHLLLAEDATTFAKQIIILYEHQSLREKMAEEGRQFIETRYDWSQSNEILRQKIEEILAQ